MTQLAQGVLARAALYGVLAILTGALAIAGRSGLPEARAPFRVVASGFKTPAGLAVDPAGNLLLSDRGSGTLYLLRRTAVSSGDPVFRGSVIATALREPAGIAIAKNEDVLVAESGTGRVLRFAKINGGFSAVPKQVATGAKSPRWLTLTAGQDIFLSANGLAGARTAGGTVLRLSAGERFTPVVDGFEKLEGLLAREPSVLLAAAHGRSGDHGSARGSVYAIALPASTVRRLVAGDFTDPRDLKLDALGSLFVSAEGTGAGDESTDRGKGVILKMTFGENGLAIATSTFASGLGKPAGLAFDGEGHLYVAEEKDGRVLRFQAPAPARLEPSPPAFTREPVVTLNGTAEPEAIVTVVGGSRRASSAPLPSTGRFSLAVPLTANARQTLRVYVVGRGGAGLASAPAAAVITRGDTPPEITGFTPREAPVGTAVTLTGRGFDSAARSNEVRFNGTPALITAANETAITAMVPVGASTGRLSLTTPRGTATAPDPFTVTRREDFRLRATPAAAVATAGGQARYALEVTAAGSFSGLVTLRADGLPQGASALFGSPALAPGQSTLLTVTVGAGTAAGPKTFSVSGTAATDRDQRTETLPLVVDVQAGGHSGLTGQVLDETGKPLRGVRILLGGPSPVSLGTTDEAGAFFLPDVPTGKQVFLIDGSSANTAAITYSTVPVTVDVQPGVTSSLGFAPRLHGQETAKLQPMPPGQATVIESAGLPGFKMTVPSGVRIVGWDGQANTQVTVKAIPVDRSPLPPIPPGQTSRVVYLFSFGKTGGGVPTGNVVIDTPNDAGGLPGQSIDLYYYNEAPDGTQPNRWEKYGTGTVSPDGTTIVTDVNPATGKPYGMPRFCCGARRNVPPPEGTRPGGGQSLGGPDGGLMAADPVDLATGFLVLTDVDLVLPGIAPLAVRRTYRTNLDNAGPFGIGTSWPYDVFLQPPPDGSPDALVLFLPGNRQALLARQPDGTFANTTSPALRGAVCTARFGNRILTFRDKTAWTFEADGRLTAMRDRNGNTVTIARDSAGRVLTVTDPAGRRLTASYASFRPQIDRLTDPAGRSVSYAYDDNNRLTAVTDAAGGVTRYTYDNANRLLTIMDARGITALRNEYDAAGRVSRQTQADGGVWALSYDAVGDFVAAATVFDPAGNVTTARFNSFGYLVSRTDALGQTTSLQRDPATNLLLAVTDPLGRTASFAYDAVGNVISVVDPAGAATRYTYETTFARPIAITDALGNVHRFEYDGTGNLTARIDPLGHRTEISYNVAGQPVAVANPLRETTRFEYDEAGNLVTVTDPAGSRWTRTYDRASRPITFTDPRGAVTTVTYDNLDRVLQSVDALGGVTAFSYDPNGNLLTVTDAKGQVTAYTADSMNRLATRTDALGREESFGYDLTGNLVSRIDRSGQRSTFVYDPLGRRVLATWADGTTAAFTYSATGAMTRAGDGQGGRVIRAYDRLDRLSEEITPEGTVEYSYDSLGRRGSLTVNGHRLITYEYDAASRLVAIREGGDSVRIAYDAAGRRTQVLFPNRTRTASTYDAAGRVQRILHDGPQGVIDELVYAYDPLGRPVSIARAGGRATGLPRPFAATYDAANRLERFNSPSPNTAYDPNGRLTAFTGPAGTTRFTWNGRGELTGVEGPGSSSSFAYDALGRRVRALVNGSETRYQHDGPNVVTELTDRSESAGYLFDLRIDAPLLRRGSATIAYHQDALGSILATTNPGGVAATTYSYDPFGGTAQSGGSSDNPLQYTSRERDATGLYYYRARYYSATFERFLSEDPVESANLYSYVRNNPLAATDPLGLESKPAHRGANDGAGEGSGFSRIYELLKKTPVMTFKVTTPLGLAGVELGVGGGDDGGPDIYELLEKAPVTEFKAVTPTPVIGVRG